MMANSELLKHINYDKAYRSNRLQAAQWVLANPSSLKELLSFCFQEEQKEISHKATWVLEFVCLDKLALLYPYFDLFFEKLHVVKKDQSLRPLAHICELIAIAYYKKKEDKILSYFKKVHKQKMIESCFDWLITDQKVACQVRAMTALYFLGTEYKWVHPELSQIITTNLSSGSAGYKARGKHTLQQIAKFKMN